MVQLGLCCTFRDEPIKFVTTTVTSIAKLKRAEAMQKLGRLCMENAVALGSALEYCARHDIGCFRVNSQILPIKTHPQHGYGIDDLPNSKQIVRRFQQCGEFAAQHQLRTCFHPDQFVVINSPRASVVEQSLLELEYQAEVAEWIGADVINIHGGGAYGDKQQALAEFARNFERLSTRVRSRLTVENDDKTYTLADLLPLCKRLGIPLVYDAHHHRCHPDALTVEQATQQALDTWVHCLWPRRPMFHLSSPLEGWSGPKPARHHDFIDVRDFPACWRQLDVTVEVEAKGKEAAVARLRAELQSDRQSDLSTAIITKSQAESPIETDAESPWIVYVLRCADMSLYTGITNDLPRRLEQHNASTGARYTRSRLPVHCVYQETQANRSLALKRELQIKAMSRQTKERLIAAASAR